MFQPQTWQPADETEATLIAAIADDATCDVYADWLEQHADHDRAELVRLHRTLRALPANDPRVPWLRDRLQILGRNVDPGWRDRIIPVARVVVVEEETPRQVEPPRAAWRPFETVRPLEWVPSTQVPAWIRAGSMLAGTAIALSIVLYWLVR